MRLHCQSLPVAVEPIPGKFIQYYFGTLYTDAARTARRHTEPACASPITDACPASAFSTSRNAVKKDVVAPGPERREPRQAVARRRGGLLTIVPFSFLIPHAPASPISVALADRGKLRILRRRRRQRAAASIRLFRGRAGSPIDHEAHRQGRRLSARTRDQPNTSNVAAGLAVSGQKFMARRSEL
jgi:hypothetical protein